MEQILVTGSEGFIGKHLCRRLKELKYKVRKYDCIQGDDVTDEVNIYGAVARVNRVIHLAGIAHLEQCQKDPLKAIVTNIVGTANLLQACIKRKVPLTYISSQYVFSRNGGIYRVTKRACEDAIRTYSNLYGLKYTIIRCGSVYGTGADKHNAIRAMVESNIKGVPEIAPDEKREYIHVNDVVSGILKTFDDNFVNKSVLLTGLHPIKSIELHSMIREILGKDVGAVVCKKRTHHYNLTPYAFDEIENDRLVLDSHTDLGAGLLEIIQELKRGKNRRTRNDRF